MKRNNIYLMQFSKFPPGGVVTDWNQCYEYQQEVRRWCIENVAPKEGFPNWQLGGNYQTMLIPAVQDDYEDFIVDIYDSVYLHKEEDRVVFALRFPLREWH